MKLGTVVLTKREMVMGALQGVLRVVESIYKQWASGRNFNESNGWHVAIEGALAEMATAKFLDRYWTGQMEYGAPDLAMYEVKMTEHEKGHLLIEESDFEIHDEHRRFVLVTGKYGRYCVVGWAFLVDIARAANEDDDRVEWKEADLNGGYPRTRTVWVKQEFLEPFTEEDMG